MLESTSYDLLIIDYELEKNNPTKNGIALGNYASNLSNQKNLKFVLETSYCNTIESAVNELNCIYYLKKPFNTDNITSMIQKIDSTVTPDISLYFHTSNGINSIINCNNIVYINSNRHNIHVVTNNNKFDFVNYSLDNICNDSHNLLIRCHKSYVVNPYYVAHYDCITKSLDLKTSASSYCIPIGRKYICDIERTLLIHD